MNNPSAKDKKTSDGINGYDERLKYLKGAMKSICQKDNEILDFKNSKAYYDKRAAFAWGLWHDPGLSSAHLNTCSNDKNKAIEGYERFIELINTNYSETNWYNIVTLSQFSAIKISKKLKSGKLLYYVLVEEAAALRPLYI